MTKGKSPLTFVPDNVGIPLVFLVFGALFIRLWLGIHPPYAQLIFYCLLSDVAVILYFFCYFFIYSKIVVFEGRLILPRTNYNGFPSPFIFGKKIIDTNSISKIIKYPPERNEPSTKLRSSFYGAKISIIVKPANNIQISYGFYGENGIENLIGELLQRNESIQVIEK